MSTTSKKHAELLQYTYKQKSKINFYDEGKEW